MAIVRPTRASSATWSRASSPDRYVPRNRQPTSRTAEATKASTRIDAVSAHWRSSSTTTRGCCAAARRIATTTASDCASTAAGEAVGDSGTNPPSTSSEPAIWRSTCTHGHSGGAPSPCHAVAHAPRQPRTRARASTSSARRVLPIPASPVSSRNAPRLRSRSSKQPTATASCLARPNSCPAAGGGPALTAPTRHQPTAVSSELDLALGPDQSLGHGRFGNQKGAGHFLSA